MIVHDAISDEAWYSPSEVAQLTKFSASTIRRAIKKKELKAKRYGLRLLLIQGAYVKQWVNAFKDTDSDDLEAPGASSGMNKRSVADSALASLSGGRN